MGHPRGPFIPVPNTPALRTPALKKSGLARAVLAFVLLAVAPLNAQESGATPEDASSAVPSPAAPDQAVAGGVPRPTLDIPQLEGQVSIDARLDEPQWQKATRVTDFHMYEPIETGEVTDKTEVLVFYDAERIYVGFHCFMKKPADLRTHIAPREDVGGDDQVGIYLDTYDDDRHAFVFYTTALGIQWDARYTEPQLWNQSWDTVYYSKGAATADGYVVEIAIPFRSLRFANKPLQRWGLALTREFAAQGTKAIWPKITHEKGNYIAQAATLEGIRGIVSNRNLELQPTLVTQWAQDPNEAADLLSSPIRYNATEHLSIAPGLTAKYGVSSNLTLDAAINPDFSQVEGDSTQLDANLRFALFYSERRPFFLEGTEAFDAPYLPLNSRSIVLPFAGLKLTGKEGPTTIGLLTAYDMHPQASITFPTLGNSIEVGGESVPDYTPGLMPWELEGRAAQVSVARIARDIGEGSTVGVMLADKEIVGIDEGRAYGFHRYAALDASLQLGQHSRLTTFLGYSSTGRRHADEVTLEGGDESTDQDDLKVELPETSIQGWAYLLELRHNTRKLQVTVTNAFESPNFRAETAFIPLVGFAYSSLYAQYMFEPKIKGLVFIRPQLSTSIFLDPNAENLVAEYKMYPSVVTRFAGQNWVYAGYSNVMERPYQQSLHAQWVNFGYESSMLKRLRWSFDYREGQRIFYAGDSVGYSYTPQLSFTFRPSSWLQMTSGLSREVFLEHPSVSLEYFPQRWAGVPGQVPIYDQSAVNTTLNVNFSPVWSLRVTGRYKHVAYEQDETERGVVNAGALLTWLPNPGTAAYLGVSRGALWDEDGYNPDGQDWRVFFKLSYLWRV